VVPATAERHGESGSNVAGKRRASGGQATQLGRTRHRPSARSVTYGYIGFIASVPYAPGAGRLHVFPYGVRLSHGHVAARPDHQNVGEREHARESEGVANELAVGRLKIDVHHGEQRQLSGGGASGQEGRGMRVA
jgi:hypothetical protein